MTKLAGKAVAAQMCQTVAEDTAAQSATHQRHHDEVIHAVSHTIGPLAKCCHMGVVTQGHSQSDAVTQHSSNRHDTLPRHIRCILDTSCQIVGTGGTHAYRTDILVATVILGQHHDALRECLHEIVHIREVLGRNAVLCHDITTQIHNGNGRCSGIHVNTYYFGFYLVVNHIGHLLYNMLFK